MNLRKGLPLALALIVGLLVVRTVVAQTGGGYDLTWWTVDGGGGVLGGGSYNLLGPAGQPEPGAVLTGGSYTLVGGCWPWWPGTLLLRTAISQPQERLEHIVTFTLPLSAAA